MNKWKPYKLEDLIEIKHGFAFKGEFFSNEPSENILLTPGNFNIGGGFKSEKFKYYNGECPKDYILQENDLIITMTDLSKAGDTLGYAAKIPSHTGIRYLHNQRLGLVIFKSEEVDKDFIYWLLRTKEYQSFILGSATGSTVKHTSPSRISSYEFLAPAEKEEQKAIAKILSSLDNKIEVNQQINATLEAMARVLFKAWFVDFEPAHANMENRPSESASLEIAKLFPSEFENDLPKGWRIGMLSEIASSHRQSINPNEIEAETAYVGLEHIPRRSIALTDWGKSEKAESTKSQFKANDILFGKLRPYFHKVVIAPIDGICSTDILVIRPKETYHFGQALINFSSDEIIQYADRLSNGAKMPRVNWSDLAKFEIVIPAKQVSEEFSKFMVSIAEKIKLNIRENKRLEQIRDSLLPRLILGKIRVGAAEKELAEKT